MVNMIFFDKAKEEVSNFFSQEFENFPSLLMYNFLNRIDDLLNYHEESSKIKPNIVFTDNIESVVKSIPKCATMFMFEDEQATMFNSRLKSLFAITKENWCVIIDIKEKIRYGIVVSFNSIKDKNFLTLLEENTTIKDKTPKVHCVIARPLNSYSMALHSISGNDLLINFSLDKSKTSLFEDEIKELTSACFSKLRTTSRKLADMKNMYRNIFYNVMNNVNGTICVVVDKDYKDNGFFADGIWLKEPICFSKLFAQTKSYSEKKLQTFADLFINMLNFDGITIVDNQGRLRAYNVFVEPNSKRVGFIVGGARKRAAYYILSSKRKGIIGVYFQSHEGEIFYHQLPKSNVKDKINADQLPKEIQQIKIEDISKEIKGSKRSQTKKQESENTTKQESKTTKQEDTKAQQVVQATEKLEPKQEVKNVQIAATSSQMPIVAISAQTTSFNNTPPTIT